jgi:hypothetical protein
VIRTLKPRSSRSEMRTDITLRSVRSLRPDKALQLPTAARAFMGRHRPISLPSAGGSCHLIAHSIRERFFWPFICANKRSPSRTMLITMELMS